MAKEQDLHLPISTTQTSTTNTQTEQSNHLPTTSEIGGPKGLEPTRYGDWEKAGRCIDF